MIKTFDPKKELKAAWADLPDEMKRELCESFQASIEVDPAQITIGDESQFVATAAEAAEFAEDQRDAPLEAGRLKDVLGRMSRALRDDAPSPWQPLPEQPPARAWHWMIAPSDGAKCVVEVRPTLPGWDHMRETGWLWVPEAIPDPEAAGPAQVAEPPAGARVSDSDAIDAAQHVIDAFDAAMPGLERGQAVAVAASWIAVADRGVKLLIERAAAGQEYDEDEPGGERPEPVKPVAFPEEFVDCLARFFRSGDKVGP